LTAPVLYHIISRNAIRGGEILPANQVDGAKHVSLVIGSGSVKCAAAIGLENVLRREGIAIVSVVECSGGSLYAALIAMGYEAQEAREMTLRLWTHDITSRHNMQSVFHMAMPRVFEFDEQFGVIDDSLAMTRLRAVFGGRSFEQMSIPLYLVATDFHTGEQVVLPEAL
jgi:NTE family protein